MKDLLVVAPEVRKHFRDLMKVTCIAPNSSAQIVQVNELAGLHSRHVGFKLL